jgi:hypothetical protein
MSFLDDATKSLTGGYQVTPDEAKQLVGQLAPLISQLQGAIQEAAPMAEVQSAAPEAASESVQLAAQQSANSYTKALAAMCGYATAYHSALLAALGNYSENEQSVGQGLTSVSA